MTDRSHVLEPDAQAIVLLCGRLGAHDDSSAKPLTRNQYNEVANWLNNRGMRPADLLDADGRNELSVFGEDGKLTEQRLKALLDRGAALAMAVEEWTNKGGWILARSDPDYPKRFRRRLRHLAPPIVYGVGDRRRLENGGVSMVGSRESSDAALAFVRDLAARCAAEGISVVSGGARGVDQASMDAALEAGGRVVGALANGLATTARKKKYREAIADNRLTLISAYHPNSRFAVWKAMGRNKHIYTLGDGTVVAHSAVESGGTWAGATENLKHDWVPLFVYAGAPVPDGNKRLIEMGGTPVDRRVLQEDVAVTDWLSGEQRPTHLRTAGQPVGDGQTKGSAVRTADDAALPSAEAIEQHLDEQEHPVLFPLVWPAIRPLLDERCSAQEVREHFDDLRLSQARDWLVMAVERGLAVREERPVRYLLAEEAEDEDDPTDDGHTPSPSETEGASSSESPEETGGNGIPREEPFNPNLFDPAHDA
jgi:predicted Rossmann fold nucleotide-binding protein DprA/Smf involved in DNA uptake